MSSKENGGAAFPSSGVVLNYDRNEHQQGAYEGMSLRDYFAAKAMAALTTVYWEDFELHGSGAQLIKCQAETAYEMADAMLLERDK